MDEGVKNVEVPEKLISLFERWESVGRPAQSGVSWQREAWKRLFPGHAEVFDRLPECLGRDAVRRVVPAASRDKNSALEAFLLSMAWGYGGVGYGPWRTKRIMCSNPNAPEVFMQASKILSAEGPISSYGFLSGSGRLKYLGPSFGTKFLYVVSDDEPASVALIFDAVVSRAIELGTGLRIPATLWNPDNYRRYLSLVSGWACQLKCTPADVELLLFVGESPGQWTEHWVSLR